MTASLLQRLGLMAAAASLALAACAAPTAPALPPGIAVAPKLIGEETTSAERPAFGDDFYGHVNHDWLSTYKLPADKSSSGATEELTEAVEALVTQLDGTYVDGTFGRGGHSRAVLAKLAPAGRLVLGLPPSVSRTLTGPLVRAAARNQRSYR